MTQPRSDIEALYVADMGAANYQDDPSANGSLYTGLPAFNIAPPGHGKPTEGADYADSSNFASDPSPGREGGEITFDSDSIGLLTSPADAASVAVDWADILRTHAFGTPTDLLREAVGGAEAVGQSVITMAAGTSRIAGDPVCFYETGHPRAQWGRVNSVAAPAFTISPPLEFALTASGFSRALRVWREILGGGNNLAFCYVQGLAGARTQVRTLLGCRLTKLIYTVQVGVKTKVSYGFRFSRQVFGGKGSLPAAVGRPDSMALKGDLSPMFINGVSAGHMSQVIVDLQPTPLGLDSVHGDSAGRAGDEAGNFRPKISYNPVHDEARYEEVRDAETGWQVVVQIGSGAGDGDPLNSEAFIFDNMGPVDVQPEKAPEGLLRVKQELTARNPALVVGGLHHFQHMRA